MYTKRLARSRVWPLVLFVLPFYIVAAGEADIVWTGDLGPLTRSELERYIKMDAPAGEYRVTHEKMLAAGTNLIPYWVGIVANSVDNVEVENGLYQLDQIGGLAAHYDDIKALFGKRQKLDQNRGQYLSKMLIQTVGQYGTASDAALILPYLSDRKASVRVSAARAVAAIGDAESLRALEAHIDRTGAPGHGTINTKELNDIRQCVDQLRTRLGALPHQ